MPVRRVPSWIRNGAVPAAGVAAALAAIFACTLPDTHAGRVAATRVALLVAAGITILILWRRRRPVKAALEAYFRAPRDPLDLAVLRIVVAWQVWTSIWPDLIGAWSRVPVGLQAPPTTGVPPLGPLRALERWPRIPFDALPLEAGLVALKVACVTMALGLFSRVSSAAVALLFLVLFGSLQWHGKVDHLNHLVWFAAILAVSPSGDALSADSLLRRLRGRAAPPAPSTAYGVPLAFVMLLIGLVYFFPGLWKLGTSGVDWFLSDNLRWVIHREAWIRGGWDSPIPLERWPLLYKAAAAATVAFELTFVFLILDRRTRLPAVVFAIAFHVLSYATMGIVFPSLVACYVAFLEWGPARRRRLAPVPGGRRVLAPALVGSALVVLAVSTGLFAQMSGWPFAAYPLFHGVQGPTYATLEIEARDARGALRPPLESYRTGYGWRWHQSLQDLLWEPDSVAREAKFRALWSVVSADDPELGAIREVRFLEVEHHLDPARWDDPPASERTLLVWRPPGSGGGPPEP